MAGRLLAEGTYKSDISRYLVTNRTLGVPLLHAPANLAGEDYLQSISPLLAVATLVAVVWFFQQGVRGGLSVGPTAALATVGILLLVTNNRFVFNAFYLNGHLLQAALVLLVVGSGWLLVAGASVPTRALMTLQIIAIPGLVVTRPEGLLVAVLALLPTWLSSIPARHRSTTLAVAGTFGTGWYGFQVWVYWDRGASVPVSLTGPLLLALLLLLATRLPRRWHLTARRALVALWAAELGLWLVLLACAVRKRGTLVASLVGTEQNLVGGEGKWGVSLIVLGVLLLAAFALFRAPHQVFLRFPLTTFLPLALLLAYLRGGPYQAGYGDSLNRMWMHVLPLAVLYVMVAAASGYRPHEPDACPPTNGSERRVWQRRASVKLDL